MSNLKRSITHRSTIFIKAAISVALLTAILVRVDWHQLADSFKRLEPIPLTGAVLSFAVVAGLEALRLQVALRAHNLSFGESLRLHLIGVLFGNFLPGQTGGDVYRVVAIRRLERSTARAASVIVVLRGLALMTTLAVAMLAAHWILPKLIRHLPPSVTLTRSFPLPVTLSALLAIALLTILLARAPRWREGLWRFTRTFLAVLQSFSLSQLAALVLLSALVTALRGIVLALLLHSAAVSMTIAAAIFIAALSQLSGLIPLTLSGLGIREGVIVGLLTLAGVSYEPSVLTAILGRALQIVMAVVGAILLVLPSRRPRDIPVPPD